MPNIIKRLKARKSNLGEHLAGWVSYSFLICGAIGATLDWASVIPEGWVPTWVKTTIVITGLISKTVGHLTIHPDESKPESK